MVSVDKIIDMIKLINIKTLNDLFLSSMEHVLQLGAGVEEVAGEAPVRVVLSLGLGHATPRCGGGGGCPRLPVSPSRHQQVHSGVGEVVFAGGSPCPHQHRAVPTVAQNLAVARLETGGGVTRGGGGCHGWCDFGPVSLFIVDMYNHRCVM